MALSFDEFWRNVQANAPGTTFDQARQVYRDKTGNDPVLTQGPTLADFTANVRQQYPDLPPEQIESVYRDRYQGFGQVGETGRALKRGVADVHQGLGRTMQGPAELVRGLGRAMGLDPQSIDTATGMLGWNLPEAAGQDVVRTAQRWRQEAAPSVERQNKIAEAEQSMLGQFGSPSLWPASVAEMAPGMAGMVGLGMLNPALGAMAGGGLEASGKYDELIAQGVPHEQALAQAAAYGGVTVPLNLLPLEKMLGPRMVANKWLNRAAVGGLEAATEAAEPAAYSLLTEGDPAQAAKLWGQELKAVGPAAFLTGAALGGGRGPAAQPQAQPAKTPEADARSVLEGLRPTQEPQVAPEPTPPPAPAPLPETGQAQATESQVPPPAPAEPLAPRKPPAPQPEGEPMPGQRFPERAMEVVTARGSRVPAVPVLVELDALTSSSQQGYDPTLQPRDRSERSAMQQQERTIAAQLDPMRLRPAVDADRGAPIVRRDGQVLSGNGRVNALRLAIQQFPERYQAYVADLAAQGYPVEGMRAPVLVMEAQGENNWTAFTKEANESATSRMSPVEVARADASRLSEQQLSLYQGGDVGLVMNAPFVRAFMSTLPQSEQNALTDAKGNLAPAGIQRVQAALLARAYGGTADADAVLARTLESTDNNVRTQTGALLDAAPYYVKLRTEIERGAVRPEFDISARLAEAMERLSKLRADRRSLKEQLDLQASMFNDLDPQTEAILRATHNADLTRPVARERFADFLRFYVNQSMKMGRLDQGGMFGDEAAITPTAVIQQAQLLFSTGAEPTQEGLFAAQGWDATTRAGDLPKPMPTSLVRQLVSQATAKWTNGPRVVVVPHASDLPMGLLMRLGPDIRAAYWKDANGQPFVHIVADKITDRFVLERALAHEAVGHYGFIQLMGDRWGWVVEQTNRLAERDAIVRRIAGEVDINYAGADANVRAAEIVAHLAERSPKHPLIQRLVAQLREALRQLGLRINLSYQDLVYLLDKSARSLNFQPVAPLLVGKQKPGWEGPEPNAYAMRGEQPRVQAYKGYEIQEVADWSGGGGTKYSYQLAGDGSRAVITAHWYGRTKVNSQEKTHNRTQMTAGPPDFVRSQWQKWQRDGRITNATRKVDQAGRAIPAGQVELFGAEAPPVEAPREVFNLEAPQGQVGRAVPQMGGQRDMFAQRLQLRLQKADGLAQDRKLDLEVNPDPATMRRMGYSLLRYIRDQEGNRYVWDAEAVYHGPVFRRLHRQGIAVGDWNNLNADEAGYISIMPTRVVERAYSPPGGPWSGFRETVIDGQPLPPGTTAAETIREEGWRALKEQYGLEDPPETLAMTARERLAVERRPPGVSLPIKDPAKYGFYERALGEEARRQLLALREDAGAFKPTFDQAVHEIQDAVSPGAHLESVELQKMNPGGYATPPLKGWDRIVEKLYQEEDGDWTQLKDMLRATVMVRSLGEMQQALDAIVARFGVAPGTRTRTNALDMNDPTGYGYWDVKVNTRGPNGRVYEIQITTPLLFDLKEQVGHKFYEDARVIEGRAKSERRLLTRKEKERIALLQAQSMKVYEPGRNQLAATSLGTGAPSATTGVRMAGSQESPLSSSASNPSGESMNRRPSLTQPTQSGPGLNTLPSIAASPPESSVPQNPTGKPPEALAQRVTPVSSFGRKYPPVDVMVNPSDQQLVGLVRTGEIKPKPYNFRRVIALDGQEFVWPSEQQIHEFVMRGLAQTGLQFGNINNHNAWGGWLSVTRDGQVERHKYNGDGIVPLPQFINRPEPPEALAQRTTPPRRRYYVAKTAPNGVRIYIGRHLWTKAPARQVWKRAGHGHDFGSLEEAQKYADKIGRGAEVEVSEEPPDTLAMADGGQGRIPGIEAAPTPGDRTLEGELGGRYRNMWSGNLTDEQFQLIATMFDQLQPAIHAQRRGTVPWSETQRAALADLEARTGINLDQFLNLKPGAAVSAELLTKYAAMLQQTVQQAQSLAAEHKMNRSDDTRLALKATLERLAVMVPATYGAMTEAGRALNILKTAAPIARGARDIIEQLGEGETANIDHMADVLTTASPNEVLGVARQLHHPTWWDKFYEVWINGLLSGATTHAVNMISNGFYQALESAATAVGYAVTSGTDMRAVGARLAAMSDGVSLGVKNASRAWQTQEPVLTAAGKVETRYPRAIEGRAGDLIRTPGRALLAEDEFFKAVAYQMELAQATMDKAVELAPEDPMPLYRDMMANPETTFLQHKDILERAQAAADHLTFTTRLGPLAGTLNHYLNRSKVGKLIVPFVRTPTNIVKSSLEYMPLGIISKSTRDALLGKGTRQEVALARGRQIVGTGLGMLVVQAAAQGLMSGAGPDDPAERQLLYRQGWQPYSLKWGNTWYRYNRFEPLGMLLGIASDMYEVAAVADEKELDTLASMVVTSFANNLGDKTFLRGISDFVQAYTDPERYGNKWVQGMAGTVVPTAVAQLAYAQDPFQRQANTVLDAIRARIPGERQKLAARVDIAGEPVAGTGSVAGVATNPLRPSPQQQDPLSRTMLELGVYKRAPGRKLYDVELSDQEYEDYAKWLGGVRQRMLTPYVQSPQFQALVKQNPVQAAKLLDQQWDRLSNEARAKYLYDHPNLYSKAYQLRQPGAKAVRSSRYLQ